MTVSDELDHKVFALTGGMGDKVVYGIADERINKFSEYIRAGEGTTAAKIGHIPTHQYTEAKDAGDTGKVKVLRDRMKKYKREIESRGGKYESGYEF